MTVIGFHCSHEQINPAQLLRDVQRAEQAGFTAGMSSDHFSPWSARQGESGFAWSFLGAALALTKLPFGVVNAPGQRYHPAIIAQAIATLAQMFPGRFWAALGSGEASNERVTGEEWPRKEVRDQRLVECVSIIRRLLHGEEVSHEGLVHVNRARLWTLPEIVPDLVGPAVTPETAARHAAWADGLVTVNQPRDTLRKILDSYREAGGRGPARLQIHLSWAPTEEQGLEIAHDQWRSNIFSDRTRCAKSSTRIAKPGAAGRPAFRSISDGRPPRSRAWKSPTTSGAATFSQIGHAAQNPRLVSRSRGPRAGPPSDPSQMGAHRGAGPGNRPRPVAQQHFL